MSAVLASPLLPSTRPAVTLPERLDCTTVADLREALQLALESMLGPDRGPVLDLVVDVSSVRVVDSVGLGLLLSIHRSCVRQGLRLVLTDPQPGLLRLLAVTRLHRVLHLHRVLDRA